MIARINQLSMNYSFSLSSILVFGLLLGCATPQQREQELSNLLATKPEILVKAIEANPTQILTALQSASKKAQAEMAKMQEAEERKSFEESFNNPLVAEIRSDESIRGAKDAALTLIEYSDFQCPFCSRGAKTVHALLKKYDGKIRLIFKHLPLDFHPQAMITAQYYEAIRLQNEAKAFAFHDEIFENQKDLSGGKDYLDKVAKKLGVDMKKLAADVPSEKVAKRIEQDKAEAAKFAMQGTPGFLLNGVPVRGAFPIEHFESIVAELKKRGKVNL